MMHIWNLWDNFVDSQKLQESPAIADKPARCFC